MTERYTVRLDDDLGEWVNAEAERRDRSRSYIIGECVEQQRGSSHTDRGDDDAVDGDELLAALADLVGEFEA